MKQPTSYKKSNTRRKTYVCRRGTAAQAIEVIEHPAIKIERDCFKIIDDVMKRYKK